LKKIEVVFNFEKMRSSSIWKNWGRLPFGKNLRSSSILKKVEVVFHISSSWVKVRLHTKNQRPRLAGTALNVINPDVVVVVVFFTDNRTTPTKVVLNVLLVGLWQFQVWSENEKISF
jgi:hypothetical protein